MKTILFVDDETKVLEALRRMLRSLRHEWDMEFVDSGQKALDRLAEKPCDVVVTDMRMPCMDGSQLLAAVRERHPATVRIILSGQCDRDTVLKAVRPAHQFLTKPCDSATLKATVARACKLRDRFPDEWHKQLVSRVTLLFSPLLGYDALCSELESPRASMERVGEIAAQDVGMAAKLLQLVSSGFFGTPQHVRDPAHAATLLGLDNLRALVQAGAVLPRPDGTDCDALDLLTAHSRTVAAAASAIAIAETSDVRCGDEAFLAGLLHDAGALVLAQEAPDRYRELCAAARASVRPVWEVERARYRTTHAEIGAHLMALWGLPDFIVDAVMYHHCPSAARQRGFGALTAVHAAEALTAEEGIDAVLPLPSVDGDYLARIGYTRRVEAWREICRDAVPKGALA
jgi:HD-like signal output (HDOD) protein/ActR/RegA family two-component response regulator